MNARTVLTAAVLLASASSFSAALPEDYIANIRMPEAPVLSEEESASADSGESPGVRSPFPWIRIIDADGDRRPDLLMLGEDIRIVIAKIDISNATLPCGNADPGSGELRDCGEGNGASSPGGCESAISVIISRAIGSAIEVDRVL